MNEEECTTVVTAVIVVEFYFYIWKSNLICGLSNKLVFLSFV